MTPPDVYFPLLISFLAFFSMIFLFLGLYLFFLHRAKRRVIIGKIREGAEGQKAAFKENMPLTQEQKAKKPIFSFLSFLGKRAVPGKPKDYSEMRIRFLKAGIRLENVAAVFFGAKIFLAVLLPVSFFIIQTAFLRFISPSMIMLLYLFLALTGFYLPDIWLRVRAGRRKRRILEGIPDALDLLVVCVEAGMGLDAAFSRIAAEMSLSNKPLSDELKLMNLEVRAGKQRQDALRNLAVRVDIDDVRSLVTLLVQTEKFGTSVGQALRVFSDSFRTKRYQRIEEIASKLPVKLLFPSILFIFPALFVTILGPAVIRIYQSFLQK
jgi:tight adherence protein C